MPIIHQKGLLQAYGATHESFTWAVRSEPAVIDVFATLYQDKDLICSFDAVNVSLANRQDLPANAAWPHQDQDPERGGLRCVQGFVNLSPNGPEDGGLLVLKGGHKVSEEYHNVFRNEHREFRWTNEMYLFKETGLKWLADRGYEWVKVNAEPGDLVLCKCGLFYTIIYLANNFTQGTLAALTTTLLLPETLTDSSSTSACFPFQQQPKKI